MKKSSLFCLFLVNVLLVSAQATTTVHPYLQSPTSTSIKVLWRTDVPCAVKVMYGTDINNLNQVVVDTTVSARHAVKLSGLAPYTKYYYAIYNDSVFAEGADNVHWFRTFPVAGTNPPTRIWAIGDFGKGNTEQSKVRDAYLNYDNVETNLWLWLGDNVYQDGTEQEYLTKVFDSIYGYKKNMSYMPFLPTPGNHDYNVISPVTNSQPPLQHTGPYYDFVDVYTNGEAGGVASGHELYYSYDYGNIHFVSLNSELGAVFSSSNDWIGANPFGSFTSSPMTQWLHQDLQANTKPWVIVYFHQPPYTDGSHDASSFWEVYMKAMRENFAPIWEQYGVDLVLTGHSHVYERSYLVKGAYGAVGDITPFNYVQLTSGIDSLGEAYVKYTQGANPNQGTVYVVQGNSGSKDSDPAFNHPYMYAEYGCDTCCGSLILDIDSHRLDGRHIDMNGQERDHFTIYKVFGEAPNSVEQISIANVSNLNVSPNPFHNSATVSFELTKNEDIKIFLTDAIGQTVDVYRGNLNQGTHKIELDAVKLKLAKGSYTIRLTTKSGSLTKSVIFQ